MTISPTTGIRVVRLNLPMDGATLEAQRGATQTIVRAGLHAPGRGCARLAGLCSGPCLTHLLSTRRLAARLVCRRAAAAMHSCAWRAIGDMGGPNLTAPKRPFAYAPRPSKVAPRNRQTQVGSSLGDSGAVHGLRPCGLTPSGASRASPWPPAPAGAGWCPGDQGRWSRQRPSVCRAGGCGLVHSAMGKEKWRLKTLSSR